MVAEGDAEEKKSKKKKDKDREGRGRKRSRSRSGEKKRRSRSTSGERLSTLAVLPPAAIDHEFEENKWALNMTLIGDALWKSMYKVNDLKTQIVKMEKKVNFKVQIHKFQGTNAQISRYKYTNSRF